MPENKKHKNSPVPGECLKNEGTGQAFKCIINMLNAQNMATKELDIEATNPKEITVNSAELINEEASVSIIKAYDNNITPKQQKEQNKKDYTIR